MDNVGKSRNAYIVKDTKTYIYAEEAKFKLAQKDELNILFIVIPQVTNNRLKERMEEVITQRAWDEVHWFFTKSNSTGFLEMKEKNSNELAKKIIKMREYFYNYIDRIRMDRKYKKYSPCRFVISTHKNTHEHLASILTPAQLILVDSGHRVFKRINKSGFIDYSEKVMRRSRYDRILFRMSGLSVYDRTKTALFTIYGDKVETGHSIIKNEFDHQRHLFRSKNVGEEVVWISTPIYAMTKGVTIDDYIEYIKTSIHKLDIDNNKLTYIPHPGKQTEEEIKYIEKHLSCKIDKRDLPVEMKIARYEKLPGVCISPFSSALANISKASDEKISIVSAWHPEFSYFRIWNEWRESVEENMNLNIQFIDIEPCKPLFNIQSEGRIINPIFENFPEWEKTLHQ